MAALQGPYVIVWLVGTSVDGLYLVQVRREPLLLFDSPVDDEQNILFVNALVKLRIDSEPAVIKTVTYPSQTPQLFVFPCTDEDAKPDVPFCISFLGRHGTDWVGVLRVDQKEARLQGADRIDWVPIEESLGPAPSPEASFPEIRSRSRSKSAKKHPKVSKGQPQRLEWEARDWVDSSILEVTALFEKHNHGSHVDSREKQQLTNAGRDVTKEWSHDQCIGKAAVLIMRQLTSFSAQSLVLAYGLQKADHFSMVHEAVIKKQVKECIAASSESGVQLADLFAAFLDKQPELMELAEKEHTQLRKEKAEQTKTAEHRELMNKLVTRTEPQQQPQQSNRAYVSGRPPRGSVGGCREWNGEPNSCSRGPACDWRHTHQPRVSGVAWWEKNKPQ
ncbi:hypothetical protein WJX77_004575 [Trebouxia sp. C0004]